MKPNTIRVGKEIEKVYVDFLTTESIRKSAGFEGLHPLINYVTNFYRDELKKNIIMIYDSYGRGNASKLATELSGYDMLPSDIIFAIKDEADNYRPLDNETLELLYEMLMKQFNETKILVVKARYLENKEWKEVATEVPYVPNTTVYLPDIYPFSKNIYCGPDSGFSHRQ